MVALISLFLVLVLSMIVVRLGSVALRMTGMNEGSARFQARSAFTGAGFTTTESEQIMSHPMRRKIVSLLIVGGNVGIVAASSTGILSVIGMEEIAIGDAITNISPQANRAVVSGAGGLY